MVAILIIIMIIRGGLLERVYEFRLITILEILN